MATLYVTQAGSGAADGTSGNPMSIAAFNALTLVPGNTYSFSGTITSTITPQTSGTSGNVITLDGASASVTNNNTSYYWLNLTNREYIVASGFSVDGQGYYSNSNINRGVAFVNTQHCKLSGCSITRVNGYGIFRFDNAHYNEVANCTISYNGYWDVYQIAPADGHDDRGDGVAMSYVYAPCKHNYIHDCTISTIGHSPINIRPFGTDDLFNIFENNTIDNNWGVYSGATFQNGQGYPETGQEVGNRALDVGQSSRSLYMGNIFKNTRQSVDQKFNHCVKLGYRHNILLENFFINARSGPAIDVTVHEGSSAYDYTGNGYNKIIHNSFYNTGGELIHMEKNNANGDASVHLRFKNNASYLSNQTTQFDNVTNYIAGTPVSTRRNTLINIRGGNTYYSNNWLNAIFSGNCLDGDGSATDQKVYSDVSGAITLTTAESSYASNFYGNVQADPLFTTIPPTAKTHFELQAGSSAIDAGDDLTTVTSADGSGTSFTVEDAGYFYDPTNWYWVGTGDVAAPEIQIGTNSANRATITNINYTTNVITVDSSVTWTTGMGVNFSKFMENSNTQPDIGARPYQGALTPITANDDTVVTTKNHALIELDPLANDDGATSIVSVSYSAGNGSTVAVKTGNLLVEYTPGTDFVGSESFTVTVTDGTYTDTSTYYVTVQDTSSNEYTEVIDNGDTGYGSTGDFAADSITGQLGSDCESVDEYVP